jgi:hypothetical protein
MATERCTGGENILGVGKRRDRLGARTGLACRRLTKSAALRERDLASPEPRPTKALRPLLAPSS